MYSSIRKSKDERVYLNTNRRINFVKHSKLFGFFVDFIQKQKLIFYFYSRQYHRLLMSNYVDKLQESHLNLVTIFAYVCSWNPREIFGLKFNREFSPYRLKLNQQRENHELSFDINRECACEIALCNYSAQSSNDCSFA